METISLTNDPNQKFSIDFEKNRYDFSIRSFTNFCTITIKINNVLVVSEQRIIANTKIISEYEQVAGNFVFFNESDDLPFYTNFGITDTLHYITKEEFDL